MGKAENIKRMKRMHAEKKKRLKETQQKYKLDQIANDATNLLVKKLSFEKIQLNTGSIKYSDVLKEFVSPYWNECKNLNDTVELFNAGMFSWNIAMHSQCGYEEACQENLNKARRELNEEAMSFLNAMVERKLQLFSEFKVFYCNVEVTENETLYGISVATMPAIQNPNKTIS